MVDEVVEAPPADEPAGAVVVVVVGISPVIGVFPSTGRLQPTSRTPLSARAENVTLRAREDMP